MLADAARENSLLAAGLAMLEQCDWRAFDQWRADAVRSAATPDTRIDDPRLVLHALAGGIAMPSCARLLDAHLHSVQTPGAPYPDTSRLTRKALRVGYLIETGGHTWPGPLLHGLLAHHDRAHVEPIVYCIGQPDSSLVEATRALGILVRPVAHLKPHEAQGLLRVDDIDILVDMCGLAHPHASRLLLMRPARAHVHLAVHASAAARTAIETVRLPGTPQSDAAAALQRCDYGLPDHGMILCSQTPAWAIGPDTFAAWMEALCGSADAHLLLFNVEATAQGHLRRAAAAWHIAPAQLHFTATRSLVEQFAIARLADVHAEPLHATDGMEAAMARARCTPLVAPGDTNRAMRPGAVALRQAGLGEFAPADRASYVSRIRELLTSRSTLAQARQRFADAWQDTSEAGFSGWLRTLEQGLESIYAERVSLASANGR